MSLRLRRTNKATDSTGRVGSPERSPVTALVLGWIIPGAGHAYAGRWGKAALFAVSVIGLLIAGFALGGGTNILPNEWWYAPQMGVGGPTVMLTPLSQYLSIHRPIDWASPVREMGTLYTAVAGLLNLLVMLDAYIVANNIRRPTHGEPEAEEN